MLGSWMVAFVLAGWASRPRVVALACASAAKWPARGCSKLATCRSHCTQKEMGCRGAIFCRLRISRSAESTAWNCRNCSSIVVSRRLVSARGQSATIKLGEGAAAVSSPRAGATVPSNCQISSVMNGIIGCSNRRMTSSAWAATRCATVTPSGFLEAFLDHLDVRTAELVPAEIVQRARRLRVVIFFQCFRSPVA